MKNRRTLVAIMFEAFVMMVVVMIEVAKCENNVIFFTRKL